jgi:hypothetical protein
MCIIQAKMDIKYLLLWNPNYTEQLFCSCDSCGIRPDFRLDTSPFKVYEDKTEWSIWKTYLYDKLNFRYDKNGFDTCKILSSYNLNELKRFYLLCPLCFDKFTSTPFISSPTIERTEKRQELLYE